MSAAAIPSASSRLRGVVLSDRLLVRARRVMARHPYLAGSLALHAVLCVSLLNLPAFEEARGRRVAQAQAAGDAQRVARTVARDLQRRVERMDEIARQLGAAPPPASAASSAEALAARAQALSDAIAAADLRARADDLARMTQLTPEAALRKLQAELDAQRLPPPHETAAEKIVRLERQARDVREARRVRAPAQAGAGLSVTRETTRPSTGTGQTHVADGIPRSMREQFKSMVRLGGPQGRVGVVGAQDGRSVNREGVEGRKGGLDAREQDYGLSASVSARRPAGVLHVDADRLREAGARVSGQGERGAPPATANALLAGLGGGAAGRVFGPGGTFATRVYLDTWYVIGPFAGRGEESLQQVYPPEEGVDLDGVYRGLAGRTLAWTFTSRGFYPFVPPDHARDAVYYAYTELRTADDRDVWLSIAADEDSMMWLDDRLVWISAPGDKPWYHPPYYARDELLGSLALSEGRRRVHLSAGVHRLLFKLHAGHERTFFSVVLAP